MNLFIKKDLKRLVADAGDPHASEGGAVGQLQRTLGPVNLVMLGIGAIIGAGIFSLTGTAAAFYAGPAIIYSFVLGGILCALAGLCYAEMAAMIPVSGSAYAYSYATMGEFIAWIIGWDLVLEYAFGGVAVTASWSGYMFSLVHKTMGVTLPEWALRLTKGPWEYVQLPDGSLIYGLWNVPATFIAIAVSCILYRGMKESAFVNNIIVIVKVAIVLLFIGLGWEVTKTANWFANPDATGIASLVPLFGPSLRDGKEIMSYGWSGVLTGAGVVFFAYIGFDAISTTAQECKNPTRDLPIGILGSLVVCTILYILVALVLTGVVPYKQLGVADPIAVGIDAIVAAKGWSILAQKALTFCVKIGALAGLTSVILVMMMGQTRVFYAMAKDGLLPWFDAVHLVHKTPHVATVINGLFVAICGGLMPISLVGELVSIGTLLAFVLVCVGVLILRFTNPEQHRPFKTPLVGIVAPGGAIACFWVMTGLPLDTWLRLIIWMAIGFTIYFTYGIKNSRLRVRA
ncbi:MAG: amino acid permease [Candidatus Ozemobacteraceae bacterium]